MIRLIALIMCICFLLGCNQVACLAFENDSLKPRSQAVMPEPVTPVEKYQPQDWRHDSTIYYSIPGERNVQVDSPVKNSSYQATLSTIQQIDRKLRSLIYDGTYKTTLHSKTPAQVIQSGIGNCFEVARLAMETLTYQGYNAHVIDVKIGSMQNWHSICVFQELDGTWSMFSATDRFIGYKEVRANSVESLIKKEFPGLKELMFLK